MIVEICGVPGAGKSFLAHALERELRLTPQPISLPLEPVSPRRRPWSRVPRKVLRGVAELIGHPRGSVRVLGAVARSRQGTARDVVARSLNWLVLRAALRQGRATKGIHVLDQGIIQELGSLGYRGKGSMSIDVADPGSDRLAPDLILVVDVDPRLADRRLAARPGIESRVELVEGDREELLGQQATRLQELLETWLQRYGHEVSTRVQRVENGIDGLHPDIATLGAILTSRAALAEAT